MRGGGKILVNIFQNFFFFIFPDEQLNQNQVIMLENLVDENGVPITLQGPPGTFLDVGLAQLQPEGISDDERVANMNEKTREYADSLKSEESKRKYEGQLVRFVEFLESQQPPERRPLSEIPAHVLETYLSFYIMSFKYIMGVFLLQ